MLPSEMMSWQPEFTDKILSRKPGAVHSVSDEADEAYSVTEQLTMTGINRVRQKLNVHGIPVYLCEACGNPIPAARRKIFPGVTLCVECQAYQEKQRKHYA